MKYTKKRRSKKQCSKSRQKREKKTQTKISKYKSKRIQNKKFCGGGFGTYLPEETVYQIGTNCINIEELLKQPYEILATEKDNIHTKILQFVTDMKKIYNTYYWSKYWGIDDSKSFVIKQTINLATKLLRHKTFCKVPFKQNHICKYDSPDDYLNAKFRDDGPTIYNTKYLSAGCSKNEVVQKFRKTCGRKKRDRNLEYFDKKPFGRDAFINDKHANEIYLYSKSLCSYLQKGDCTDPCMLSKKCYHKNHEFETANWYYGKKILNGITDTSKMLVGTIMSNPIFIQIFVQIALKSTINNNAEYLLDLFTKSLNNMNIGQFAEFFIGSTADPNSIITWIQNGINIFQYLPMDGPFESLHVLLNDHTTMATVIGPIMEEIIFRGIMKTTLNKVTKIFVPPIVKFVKRGSTEEEIKANIDSINKWVKWGNNIIVSFTFALIHIYNREPQVSALLLKEAGGPGATETDIKETIEFYQELPSEFNKLTKSIDISVFSQTLRAAVAGFVFSAMADCQGISAPIIAHVYNNMSTIVPI
jgi:membrane protease YdiL (CAAX protease family)